MTDKVVVITGGTHGLGKTLAELCLEHGARVIVCARDDENEGFAELEKRGIMAIKADVTKEGELRGLADMVVDRYGRIDIWINNAGIWLPHEPVEGVDWARAHDLMEVNLFGTVYGSKSALMRMREQGMGMIVNILSVSALEGRATSSAYCASKYAANGFTLSLRKEVEGTALRVLAVYPGGIKTELYDEKRPENYGEYMEPSFVAGKIVENLEKDVPEEDLIMRSNYK